MKISAQHLWQEIDDETSVMKVPGGAIYRCTLEHSIGDAMACAASMVFVPMDDETAVKFWACHVED